MIDEFTRECLAMTSLAGFAPGASTGADAARERPWRPAVPPVRQWSRVRRPCHPALAADGADRNGVHRSGKPWQNGADESFNGKFRDQHLSLQWFRNRLDAKVSIEAWRRHYNEVRPHSSLGYLTPAAFKAKHVADVEGGRSSAMPARADRTAEETTNRPLGVILQ